MVGNILKTFSDTLHRVPNPLRGLKKRFSRYVVITAVCGTFSYVAALILLHSGMWPLLALTISAGASGLISYGALELWAFPQRKGRLSWNRLIKNAAVGVSGFAVRYGVLMLGLRYLHVPPPLDYAVPLALAYLSSFLFGWLFRSQVIFRK